MRGKKMTADELATMVLNGTISRKCACEAVGISPATVTSRIKTGWSLVDALATGAQRGGDYRRHQPSEMYELIGDTIPNPSHPDGDLAHLTMKSRRHNFEKIKDVGSWERENLSPEHFSGGAERGGPKAAKVAAGMNRYLPQLNY